MRAWLPTLLLGLHLVSASTAGAQATLPSGFQDQLVVGGLSFPTGFALLPDGRCLVTEQFNGRIRLIVNGALSSTDPVCTLADVRDNNFSRGLYGIVVDPRWPASPYVYVHYASNTGLLRIARLTVTGDLAFAGTGALTINPSSRYDLFTDLRDAGHNGGTLRFGADQMLYASVGDSFNTAPCAAQRLESGRGILMRLEIRNLPASGTGPPAKSLITPPDNPFVAHSDPNARLVWVHGFRNPFRFHIDAPTGEVFVADVGESNWEEINRVASPGLNFGWPIREGPDPGPFGSCPGAPGGGFVAPIHAYDNAPGESQAVIGGGVYRRPAYGVFRFPAEYDGDYFFTDHYTGLMRRLKGSGASWSIAPPVPGQPAGAWATNMAEVTEFLPASDGSLWYCRLATNFAGNTGQIRRIVYNNVVAAGGSAPGDLELSLPHPQPARHAVTLAYRLPAPAAIQLAILDLSGRRVRALVSHTHAPAGRHETGWDGRDDQGRAVPAGLYFACLDAGGTRLARRVVLAR